MKPLRLTLLLMAAIAAQQAYAQDIQSANLTWTVDQLTDLKKAYSGAYSCVFTTSASGISWTQKNRTTSIVVQSSSGSWSDITAIGSITFQVTIDGVVSTLTFERNQDGVFVTMDCTIADPTDIKYKYRVSSVQPN